MISTLQRRRLRAEQNLAIEVLKATVSLSFGTKYTLPHAKSKPTDKVNLPSLIRNFRKIGFLPNNTFERASRLPAASEDFQALILQEQGSYLVAITRSCLLVFCMRLHCGVVRNVAQLSVTYRQIQPKGLR